MYWNIALIAVGIFLLVISTSSVGRLLAYFMVVIGGVQLLSEIYSPVYTDQDISEAKMIANCKVREENIYHGLFARNTNKLDCNGIIKNISVNDYDKAIEISKEQ